MTYTISSKKLQSDTRYAKFAHTLAFSSPEEAKKTYTWIKKRFKKLGAQQIFLGSGKTYWVWEPDAPTRAKLTLETTSTDVKTTGNVLEEKIKEWLTKAAKEISMIQVAESKNPLAQAVRSALKNQNQGNNIKSFLEQELYNRANRVLDRQKIREAKSFSRINEGVTKIWDLDDAK